MSAWITTLLLLGVTGCSAQHDTPLAPNATLGNPCRTDADCSPPDTLCSVSATGASVCVWACSEQYADDVQKGVPADRACIDGRTTPCEQLPSTTCGCGCPSGELCQVTGASTGQCVPFAAPGETCAADYECTTGVCFHCWDTGCTRVDPLEPGTCSVPLGSPCTSTNCEVCVTEAGGVTWCSASCYVASDDSATPCNQGFSCLAHAIDSPNGICYADCTPTLDAGVDAGLDASTDAGAAASTDGGSASSCFPGTSCTPFNDPMGETVVGYSCQ